MKFVKINAPLGLHFKLFFKKKEKLLKKNSKIKNSGQIYDSIFKENEFLLPSQLIFVSDVF